MADPEGTAEILKKVPLFQNLKKHQLQSLARIFIDRKCAAGEVIVPQGRDGYGFFIVVSGHAEAVREKADGSKTVVNTFGPGDFFGEVALLDSGPRTASVVATEPTECLILPRENFLGVLRRDGDMAVDIMVELAKRFRTSLDAYQ
ncbi:MAG TPA: cyclic nucleotide-binding domain-containing protein [Anaerolineae bacterium]|nr:cyclic nucleotide-binding domain-containing protein [Anaerolineae bacterium]HQH39822.1 cyclic nucleotide-binding domain-containing protein [Anaerolineae bacterium]